MTKRIINQIHSGVQLDLFNGYKSNAMKRHELINTQTFLDKMMRQTIADKLRYENLHLSKGMIFTEKNEFPQLEPYNGIIPSFDRIFPYTMRNSLKGTELGLHFFIYDSRFANSLWNRLEQITKTLVKFDVLFTPDYSCFVNSPTEFVNKMSIYKTRFVGAYWQNCGFNVIPTASYGDVDSFKWCFEGLPENSIIAIGNETVHIKVPSSVKLWQMAVNELEIQKHPSLILVYGKCIDVPGINTPVQYIPGFIQTHFRNGKN